MALNSSKNLSVAEKLIILYRKKQSEARKLVSKLNAGECRKVHNYLRNLITSRQSFAEDKSNRVMLIKLVNDLVTWQTIGAETLKNHFTVCDLARTISAASKGTLNTYLCTLLKERIPNIPSVSQTLFRAALECPDVASLKQVCQAFKDFSQYLDLGLVLKAIRKLLSRLGSTRGMDQITSTRNGHQMMYSAICVLKSIPKDIVQCSNLFNRNKRGIPVLNSNVFQLLSLQSLCI